MSAEHVEHPVSGRGWREGVLGHAMIETWVGILQIVWHDIIIVVVDKEHVEIVGLIKGMDLLIIEIVIPPNVIPRDEGLIFGEGDYVR